MLCELVLNNYWGGNENTILPKDIHEGDEFKDVLSSHHIAPFVFEMTTEKRVIDLLQKFTDESP